MTNNPKPQSVDDLIEAFSQNSDGEYFNRNMKNNVAEALKTLKAERDLYRAGLVIIQENVKVEKDVNTQQGFKLSMVRKVAQQTLDKGKELKDE